jgi:hypothetical protein
MTYSDDDTLDHVKLSDLPPSPERIDPDESDPALVVLTCMVTSILIMGIVFLVAMIWNDSEQKRQPAPDRVQEIPFPDKPLLSEPDPWDLPTPQELWKETK